MITQEDIIRMVQAAELAGFTVDINQINLLTWQMGLETHIPLPLPVNHSAVYVFTHGDTYLKVGQAGPESNARYQSQHYSPSSSPSNLAKSLINDHNYSALIGDTKVKAWIRSNTHRFNILIPTNIHLNYKKFVAFAEAFFILQCLPKFER